VISLRNVCFDSSWPAPRCGRRTAPRQTTTHLHVCLSQPRSGLYPATFSGNDSLF